MNIILFDLMDTVIVDPYRNTVKELTPPEVDLEKFQSVRDMKAFIDFEKGEISELDFFRKYYEPDFDFQKNGFPRPQKIKKYLYRQIHYIDGMKEILRKLNECHDILTGIASNYSIWYLEVFKKKTCLEDLFDYLFFSCEMGIRKPDMRYFQIIQDAISRTGEFNPENDKILFIDDRAENVRSAEKAGWHGHHFTGVHEIRGILEEFTGRKI